MPRLSRVLHLFVLSVLLALSLTASAQMSSVVTAPAAPMTINGRVINAITGAPVLRALVQLDAHARLTDSEGRFSFTAASNTSSTLRIHKPGYYASPEGDEFLSVTIPTTPGTLVTASLYPEAILSGTLTSQDGSPLSEVRVTPQRSTYTESGHQWIPQAPRQTNSRGEFRLAIPSGDYRIETSSFRRASGSTQIIIPQIYPQQTSPEGSRSVHLNAGAQETVDLHSELSPSFEIPVHLESTSGNDYASLTAMTAGGAIIPANLIPGGPGGSPRTELPRGTYTLTATKNRGEQTEFAETTVTVTGPNTPPITLRFAAVAPIPVQIIVDSSTSDKTSPALQTPPTAQQLGVSLVPTSPQALPGRGAGYIGARDKSYSFLPMPGTYRLMGRAGGPWFIKSASSGSVDLLQQDLVVTAGAGSAPIVLTISNQLGTVSGTVKVSGAPQAAWVYMIPRGPSATPFYTVRSSPSGLFVLSTLPPGSYQIIAFEQRRPADYRSPAILAPYSTHIQNVTVIAGTPATVDLDAVTAAEMAP
jgi:hypothetical protein